MARRQAEQALVSDQASKRCLDPSGFDPSRVEWKYTRGTAPDFGMLGTVIWAMGRYGDIYGPIPGEMLDPEAWLGNMGGAAHDLVAWAPCTAKWRDIFPYRPRDPASDSDGSPQGGDACGSVHDSAGRNGIAEPQPHSNKGEEDGLHGGAATS